MWDGIESGRLLAKMHGTQPEKTSFESSENQLMLLKDSINVSGTGGILESPNYPNTYPDNLDQIYHIKVDPSMVAEITILNFVTDSTFDELVIDDGSKMGDKVLKILFENKTKNLLMVITCTQSAASMRFVTDESNEKPVKGWRLSWNAVPRA
ncbi:hypothetical protein L596_020122 [Steinernema carpocapsae]|uniref:CUB domain-containing protein n=1 Tax=Steinernema carpocapsae TaxID=34508 RepID=A0A4V6A0U4_STECR|nr:hypothetical protein L596_020122 [Steinernema carpocapsae]